MSKTLDIISTILFGSVEMGLFLL